MAIEAGNHPFPPSQFITDINNREFAMMNQILGGTIFPDTHMVAIPETTPLCRLVAAGDSFLPGKGYAKEADDSGLTSNNINGVGLASSRKRSRDCYSIPNDSSGIVVSRRPKLSTSWFEQEAALQMQRQQIELDCLIAQHTQRMRLELEERARQQTKALASAIRETVITKLREKDEEIQRIAKLNWALRERIMNLCVENQLWRELAQTNEAAANSLRTDLERVMTGTGAAAADDNDAESCCGSNEEEGVGGRRCKGCGGGSSESEGVVVMPCRHVLMECTRCGGSSRQSCPVCGSSITATVHVHLPSS